MHLPAERSRDASNSGTCVQRRLSPPLAHTRRNVDTRTLIHDSPCRFRRYRPAGALKQWQKRFRNEARTRRIEVTISLDTLAVNEKALRDHLVTLLSGRGAHVDWKSAFAGIPPKLKGVRPKGAPHSVWELLEHMRIAQRDILEFSRNAKHVSPNWPDEYWPESPAPPNAKAWTKSLTQFD